MALLVKHFIVRITKICPYKTVYRLSNLHIKLKLTKILLNAHCMKHLIGQKVCFNNK